MSTLKFDKRGKIKECLGYKVEPIKDLNFELYFGTDIRILPEDDDEDIEEYYFCCNYEGVYIWYDNRAYKLKDVKRVQGFFREEPITDTNNNYLKRYGVKLDKWYIGIETFGRGSWGYINNNDLVHQQTKKYINKTIKYK